ncbi:homeobox protein engrailed-2b [Anopheles aquasalis]|uniref:homeobox protein engrailed-2b n=1 Tax=Anopheles aquasalis TaxID=42839 RepID=UPI00215A4423|nr:homeobox protein engrailed-2b [Anopheles aquasalis]
MASAPSCKSVAPLRQSDFSIEHILTRAGERYEKRRRIDQCSSCCTSSPGSDGSGSETTDGESRLRAEVDVEGDEELEEEIEITHSRTEAPAISRSYLPSGSASGCGTGGVPSFDWLYYTRYHPPKLPRPQKVGPVKRTPGRLPRVPFTPAQLGALEDAYKVSTYLSSEEANQLAYSLELTNTRVKIWFQNRRARDRREKREASIANGNAVPAGPIPLYAGGAGPTAITSSSPHAQEYRSHPSSPSSVECPTERHSKSPASIDRSY